MSGRVWLGCVVALGLLACAGCASSTEEVAPPTDSVGVLVPTAGGQSVEVINTSPDATALVVWAIGRFEATGLAEPTVQRIEFAAGSPKCEGSTAWAATGKDGAEIVVCLDVHRMCRRVNGLVFTVAGRICILHELSHLWLSEYVAEPARQAFMDMTGAASWRDPDVPWAERGVEQAADTIAWGLLGETIEILGRPLPPCEQLPDGFMLLTGVTATSDCDHF